jgi:hypothetical protein
VFQTEGKINVKDLREQSWHESQIGLESRGKGRGEGEGKEQGGPWLILQNTLGNKCLTTRSGLYKNINFIFFSNTFHLKKMFKAAHQEVLQE